MRQVLVLALVGISIGICGCKPSRNAALEVKAVAAANPEPAPAEPVPSPDDPAPQQPQPPVTPFAFPEDWGGKLLERTLPPSMALHSAREGARGPLPRKVPVFIEQPEVTLAPAPLSLPALATAARKPLRPWPLTDTFPFQANQDEPQIPDRPRLASGVPSSQRAPNVNEPPPLPTLAKPVTGRASFEDPTADFSNEQAIARELPLRTKPAPFQRVDLPEPFEPKRTPRPMETEPTVVPPVPMPPK
jgi:hypothetical protein